MAVGAVQRVRVGESGAGVGRGPHALAEIFQVHLVADAGARRHHAEIVERLLAPAQEAVAFVVTLEFDLHVLLQRIRPGIEIDLHRVVDHQVHRDQRVDLFRAAAKPGNAVAHRCQIDDRGHPGEILHQDAGGLERHLLFGMRRIQPAGDRLGIVHLVAAAVFEPEHIFQQDLQADREAGNVAQGLGGFRQRVIVVVLALHRQGAAGLQCVLSDGGHVCVRPGLQDAPLLCGAAAWYRARAAYAIVPAAGL